MIEITSRFAIILVKYSKFNKRRHPNKSIGMGKFFKINKRMAYVYSELKSTSLDNTVFQHCIFPWVLEIDMTRGEMLKYHFLINYLLYLGQSLQDFLQNVFMKPGLLIHSPCSAQIGQLVAKKLESSQPPVLERQNCTDNFF